MISIESRNARNSARATLRETGGAVVALSGGVDSAVLLWLALDALGRDRVVAVTAHSASVPRRDLADARRVAAGLGARHEIVETRELERAAYRANSGDRCFHCRTELFETLLRVAREHGLAAVAYGAIVDDLGDDRPGMEAAERMGVLAPLLTAGFTKREVRRLARAAGLPVHEKPAAACLSSRIPRGQEVTPEKLRQIEAAEEAVRDLGFRQVRVRHHGEIARIELGPDEMGRLAEPGVRDALARGVRDAGFPFVTVDLAGYRTGGAARSPGPLLAIGASPGTKRD